MPVRIYLILSYSWQKFKLEGVGSKQVGLKGEAMNLVSPNSASSVDWIQGSLANRQQPLKWYKVIISGKMLIVVSNFT